MRIGGLLGLLGRQPVTNVGNTAGNTQPAVKTIAADPSATVEKMIASVRRPSASLTFVAFGHQFELDAKPSLPKLIGGGVNPDGYPGEEWIWESEACA
jgi:hypothetical protein